MTRAEFKKIIDGFTTIPMIKAVGISPEDAGVLPALPAIAVLSVLRDQLHQEDRDSIEIGISPKGHWYVNIRSE